MLRAKLGFVKEIKNNFGFLVNEFDYTITYVDDYYVEYKSKITYVEIYHDRISYEMSIVFGLNINTIVNFRATIMDILEAKNVDVTNKLFQASSKSSLKIVIENLAYLVKTYAKEFLLGDIDSFKNVQSYVNNKLDKLTKQDNLLTVEKMANIAWENKEYERLINLYSGILIDLNEIQKRRFAYANSKVRSRL